MPRASHALAAAAQVISAFDVSGDGSITFDEFLRGIRGGINKRRRELVSLAFDVLDKDHSGEVTIEDVAAAYDVSQHPDVKAGKTTPKDVLSEFMSQWDKGVKDGKITRDEFLEYYKDVSASIDDDDYFELVIRNAWHISGGEGWAGVCRARLRACARVCKRGAGACSEHVLQARARGALGRLAGGRRD